MHCTLSLLLLHSQLLGYLSVLLPIFQASIKPCSDDSCGISWCIDNTDPALRGDLNEYASVDPTKRICDEARMLVPSFGSWDTGTEIPFTTVFEKVRATKDGKILNARDNPPQTPSRQHRFEGNPSMIHPQYDGDKFSNASSELHRGKRSVLDEWGVFQRKASDLQSSSSRRSSLEQIADHIFTESQHAAGNESPVISRQSTSSNASWPHNQAICSRDLREQYVKDNMYNHQPMPGGLPSAYHQGHQAIGSRMPGPAASPRRERLFPGGIDDIRSLYPPMPAMRLHQQSLQANHISAAMPPNKVLPKFGDWDAVDPAGVEFTVIFDKARNERKCSINQDAALRDKADPGVDEDLYKPTSTQRKSGFWALLCCSHSSMS